MRFAVFTRLLAIAMLSGCRPTAPAPAPMPAPVEAPGHTPKNDSNAGALYGTWKVVAIESDLRHVASDVVNSRDIRFTFKGNELTQTETGKDRLRSHFAVDNSANPKRIAIYATNPPERGVYEIAGDHLRLCIIVEDNPRGNYPSEIACRQTPKTDVLTLEKVNVASKK